MTDKRLLIFLTLSLNRKKNHNMLINSLADRFEKVISISDGDALKKLIYSEFSKIENEFTKIYIVSDGIILSSDDFDKVFEYMEKTKSVCSLWNSMEVFGAATHTSIKKNSPLFICANTAYKNLKKTADVLSKADSLVEMADLLMNFSVGDSYFSYWMHTNFPSKNEFVPFCFNAFEYLKAGFPFVPYAFFLLDHMNFINYGTDNVPSDVFNYLISDFKRSECLFEYFAEECDASKLKRLLQLNFFIPKNRKNLPEVRERCAVFVHLHYEQYFERYLKYLADAANSCNVYISVNTEEKKKLILSTADAALKSRMTVVICENRGRDLSSLLVAFKPYISDYEYFCFLHDKSSHKNEAETVGRAFSDCMWNNILDIGIIPEIISLFEKNSYIGLLVPPAPYWGVYQNLKSDFWTVCYDKTLELAKKLRITVKIEDDINPVALGTAFWCRKNALLSLLEYPWRYEDFDEEPLMIDGTINHALERILPYAALDRHFLTAWIISEEFAPRILESHLFLNERQMRQIKQCPIPSVFGKTAEQIGLLGSFCAFKESLALLFKSLGKFLKKRLHK